MNREEITELKAWREDARRGLEREVEQLREKKEQIDEYLKALDATDGLLAEVEDLKEELEDRQQEVEELTELVQLLIHCYNNSYFHIFLRYWWQSYELFS